MKPDSIAFGVAGIVFGLIAGWIIGTQQGATRQPAPAAPSAAAAPASSDGQATRPAIVDQQQVNALTSVAAREPKNPKPRIELANLYFDADRYDDAIKWYTEAVALDPKDVNASTDLGVCYYYTNQPDKALAQFDHSLSMDPKHAKTLLNVGIVKAFGKQDLDGAEAAWKQVLAVAPDGPEGQAAKRALDSLTSAHAGIAKKPSD